ncbi:MAG: response regulator transcription factor [Bacteroidetes bacterium]|nr:response regulator transcription factor [Bacteroidota bacterium]
MRILVADDHDLVRQGLVEWLKQAFPFAEIKETNSGLSAEKIARSEKLDVMILDISLPDKDGLEVLKQLRSEGIKTPVLVLSIHSEEQYALRVFKAGANGYMEKNCAQDDFIKAVKVVTSNRKYISSKIAEKMVAMLGDNVHKELHELISDRELQVLKLIASGKAVSMIAEELSLSVATVSTYRARLLEKMQLANNSELTRYAIDNELV